MHTEYTSIVETALQNGYPLYRIPGIVVTHKGTVIVCYEARMTTASRGIGDWSVIDLYIKRSLDGGKTWLPRQKMLSGNGKNTTNNPVLIVDGEKIHFIGLENYKRAFTRVSEDDGETWSEAKEITCAWDEARDQYDWTVIAAGPGHGFKHSSGRLIVPVWYTRNTECIYAHNPARCGTVYSDDRGETWHAGDVLKPDFMTDPNESAVAETKDGGVVINMRSVRPGEKFIEHRGTPVGNHYRAQAYSKNGYSNWENAAFQTDLPDPECASGMCNFPGGIIYTGCDSVRSRTMLTLKVSKDDGKTWSKGHMYEVLGGYSDCYYSSEHEAAFVAYEHNDYLDIRVSKIHLAE
ncbi:MAG: exo-alpha-sialidase [Clostridia bacterium]|nr:exo-alpha-sialidase [Clostridia bacterium]